MTIELLLEQPGHMVAWKPEDMKRIGPEVAVHKLNINPNAKPIKQKRRHFEEQKSVIIEKEVEILLKVGL